MVAEHLPIPRWRGLRVIAAHGSKVRLTLMNDDVRSIAEGVAFGLYLPGIELFLDFALPVSRSTLPTMSVPQR